MFVGSYKAAPISGPETAANPRMKRRARYIVALSCFEKAAKSRLMAVMNVENPPPASPNNRTKQKISGEEWANPSRMKADREHNVADMIMTMLYGAMSISLPMIIYPTEALALKVERMPVAVVEEIPREVVYVEM